MKTRIIRYACTAVAVAAAVILLNTRQNPPEPSFEPRDYPQIAESGILRAVTEYNAISYHVDKDTIRGFDYELLNAFAKAKGLKLELTPEMSFNKRLQGIMKGQYDILGAETAVTTAFKDSLLFTRTILLSKQVLVQRKPDADTLYIRNQLELAQKTLHVIKDSPALVRIHNLMSEIADTIYTEEVELYGEEQLMAMVAGKDIDYAVCDENIAQATIEDYPNLDINTDIGFTQLYAWGVSKHSPILCDSLNHWLEAFLKSKEYHKLYKKYFK